MRVESSVTAITWIPSEAVEGLPELAFDVGLDRYDEPPRDTIGNLDRLRAAGAFRAANELRAWIDVKRGSIVDYGYEGRGLMGARRASRGRLGFAPVELPLVQPDPEVGADWARFVQTAGGPIGIPLPRRVAGKPFVRLGSAVAWTTLQLVIYADGQARGSLVGASSFPRHWIYDDAGRLIEKSATTDFRDWQRQSAWEDTPWGGEDTRAFVTAVESELERSLAASIMAGDGEMPRRMLEPGEVLVPQGAFGLDLFLLLDGVLEVEVDGKLVAQVGPGAVLGELAGLEREVRTATLRAVTPCRLVVVSPAQISRYERAELARSRAPQDA